MYLLGIETADGGFHHLVPTVFATQAGAELWASNSYRNDPKRTVRFYIYEVKREDNPKCILQVVGEVVGLTWKKP